MVSGMARLVLQACLDFQGGDLNFVSVSSIAEYTHLQLKDVRDALEILAELGLVEVIFQEDGLSASVTAIGRMSLGQMAPPPFEVDFEVAAEEDGGNTEVDFEVAAEEDGGNTGISCPIPGTGTYFAVDTCACAEVTESSIDFEEDSERSRRGWITSLWRWVSGRNRDDIPSIYSLWYGTNRKPKDPANISLGYTGLDDERLHYGSCSVLVPKSHKIGELGSPWWWRWLTRTDDRLKIAEITGLEEGAFWSQVHEAVASLAPDSQTAVIFIHGFNVDFEEAALRAAQIGADLQAPGIMAFYSWPSLGQTIGYTADEATIEASEPFITEFLTRFASESGASRIHIIAHSMGNRGLLRAFQRMVGRAEFAGKIPFDQIILAAPDIDARMFRDLASVYSKVARKTTMYVSARDLALRSSGLVHGRYPRAGFTPPVTLVPGLDTVEVSGIDLTLLGHGYIADARDVMHDIYHIMVNDLPPERRMGLRAAKSNDGTYWVIGR